MTPGFDKIDIQKRLRSLKYRFARWFRFKKNLIRVFEIGKKVI